MLVTGFPAGMFQTNCYILAQDDASECVVVDPGQDAADPLVDFLTRSSLTPTAVLLTHGHLDHTWSVEPVCSKYGIPAYIAPEDRYMLADPIKGTGPTLAAVLGDLEFHEPDEVIELAHEQRLSLAGIDFTVVHTPGHTQGSVVFLTEANGPDGTVPLALTGDTLFAGSIGRTDLPGGDHDQLLRSIASRLLPLRDETVVLPGHGGQSSIGQERGSNPFLVGLGDPEQGKL
ncbi:MBL fold metallo-hydrolase [Rhodococcus fascians]|uniref:MBL fold metallo-hydrolase n=1 Tax=Nocardiaceae TaxID=85025 RepID=UPI00050C1832|nr:MULTISPECIES: MBL fold metallo-hydrolase [Rhodococcus]MBY3792149.1 MBL fold metallo-hydrolase [Rhodococcus fascians]MDP9636583.1 hydroxyacylglutathione hydrolase [Rhodococcus cercidiphylli]KQU29252.1 hydrolase [Rhodococcus sp. Leaf233]MBY3824845.1 MBL fold metallo-hydrolase [Rhodococcus fascians]MBY3835367.1 MBL fold metallo-hydrolase [Rhodococcus fascians]